MPTLTAVSYDPFAPKAAKPPGAPKLTAVQGDPFATAAPPKPAAPKPAAPKPAAPKSAAPKRPGLPERIGEAFMRPVREYPAALQARMNEAAAMAKPAAGPDDLVGAALSVPRAAMGVVGGMMAVPTAAVDVLAGKPLAKATVNAPHGEHYDLRLPENFAGDTAATVGGFLVGGKPGKAPGVGHEIPDYTPEPVAAGAKGKGKGGRKSAKLTPVEGDPFAAPVAPAATAAKPAKLTPVEGDPFAATAAAPRKGKRKPAEQAEAAGATPAPALVSPGPNAATDASGPVVGGETNTVERVDNALYRLGGHATADKLETAQFLDSLPEELKNPALQEELYHAIEARLADPNAQIPAHLQPAMDAMRPYYEEQTAIINRLRERADPEVEYYLEDQGYVARRVKGQTPLLDTAPGAQARDPINGTKSLFKSTNAQRQRTAGSMVTDADGQTHFIRGEVPETDIQGRPYASVRQATTKEIEANTPLRYHKNALVNTLDNVMRLRRVERNLQVLDEVTKNLKAEGRAWQSEWHYRDPQTGHMVRVRANTPRPEGFTELAHVPQLRGWYFPKDVAETLRDYFPGPEEPLDGVLAKVNRALTSSLFITPIPHAANVMAHWSVGRGWDWMTPGGYKRLMQTGARAVADVLTKSPNYRRMLREGSALLYGDTQVRDFHELLLKKAGGEFFEDPKAVSIFAKAAGLPVAAVKGLYRASNQVLWAANDIFMLQRQYELMAKGMNPRKAIKEAERDIPNYRIPPQVLGSRAVSQWLQSHNVMMFGRYKYGQARAWGVMVKDLVKGTPEQRVEAAGKVLMTLLISNVAYPMADQALRMATGNKDARVKRSGGFSQSDALWQMATGQKDAAVALSSFMSPAPVVAKGIELADNHDFFGKPIRTPGAPPWMQAAEVGKYAAQNSLYPVQLGSEAVKGPDGAVSALGKLAGLELPPPEREANKVKYRARDRKKGAKAAGRLKSRIEQGKYGEAWDKLGR